MEGRAQFISGIAQAMMISIVLSYFTRREYKKLQQNSDTEWGKYVTRLHSEGVDPSRIKRTSEWDKQLEQKMNSMRNMSILFGIIAPLILITFTVIYYPQIGV